MALNAGQTLSVAANAGSFQFATALASGAVYNVTVQTQPAGQTCSVTNGAGTVTDGPVYSVLVGCSAIS